MLNDAELDGTELVQQYWPYDGPHTPERLADAFDALSALVRYTTNATVPTRRWGLAPQVYRATGGLSDATEGLPQLLDQLASWAAGRAQDATLRHDEHREGDHSVQAAHDAASTAQESLAEAHQLADQLAACVSAARQQLSHLYHED